MIHEWDRKLILNREMKTNIPLVKNSGFGTLTG